MVVLILGYALPQNSASHLLGLPGQDRNRPPTNPVVLHRRDALDQSTYCLLLPIKHFLYSHCAERCGERAQAKLSTQCAKINENKKSKHRFFTSV